MRKLTNPDINPKVFALLGTSAADKTSFYFDDACGLASLYSAVDTTNGVALVPATGTNGATAIKRFLQSYAMLIKEYRFYSENDANLSNNLTAVRSAIDGNNATEVLFSSDAVSPFQNNPNLLVIKQPFVWTSTTALKVTTTAGTGNDMTFTFTVSTMIPYGQLDAFLGQNPIAKG